MEKTIGFIGLGNMGMGMARSLMAAGFGLRAYNRSIEKTRMLAEGTNAVVCSTPAEACQGVQTVVSMLSDDAAVGQVITGETGMLAALEPGAVHLSSSTISPSAARRFAKLHDARGIRYIAAPVFGRPAAAASAQLHILLSGADGETRSSVRPVLDAMGRSVWDFGADPGAANVAKLCGNFLILAATEAMAEAYTLAEKSGVDRQSVNEMLTGTLFTSPAYKLYGGIVAAEKYQAAGFSLPLALKDVRLFEELGRESQTPLPTAALIEQRMISALAKGWGDQDAAVFARESSDAAGLRRTV